MLIVPGTCIGPYTVEQLVGTGGTAEVWAARRREDDSVWAIKVLLSTDPELRSRLLAEGRVQATLVHPNLLPVDSVMEHYGRPMLVLPLIDGPSLSALLHTYRPSPPEAVALLAAITAGLAFAHAQGFIHRDLKPGNVLLDVSSTRLQPRIADFGLVKSSEHTLVQTRTGMVFGTPAYAAPEQLHDASSVDKRADLFSLGVLATLMLTGKRPFDGRSVADLVQAHEHPPTLNGVPADLLDLISDMLQRDPARRPSSADEVLARLGPIAIDALSATSQLTRTATQLQRVYHPQYTDESVPTLLPRTLWSLAVEQDFVGRHAELAALTRWRDDPGRARLLTVTGSAGTGKTRLVEEFAERGQWAGEVHRCDLCEAVNSDALKRVVALALDVKQDRADHDPLPEAIAGRGALLLVLDNFEQLIDGGAQVLQQWMTAAPMASLLVTSRSPLRLPSEQVLPLDILSQKAAAVLFVTRAKAAGRTCDPNDVAVLELVELLDRLPLAIELAAARSRMYSPSDLQQRLNQRFRLLTRRDRDVPDRQRSLLGSLLWSWDLLKPHEQQLLAQTSVFTGPFSLTLAEKILTTEADDVWVEDVLGDLLDGGWLRRVSVRGKEQLTLLVSVRSFISDRLLNPVDVEIRHGAWFSRPDQPTSALFETIGAAERAARRGHTHTALACVRNAASALLLQGPFSEGLRLLNTILQSPTLTPAERTELLVWRGAFQVKMDQHDDATPTLHHVIASGTPQSRRTAHLYLGKSHLRRDQLDDAEHHLLRALDLSLDDPRSVAQVSLELAELERHRHQYPDAENHLLRALEVNRTAGDKLIEGHTLGALGRIYYHLGRSAEAEVHLLQALASCADTGNRTLEGTVRKDLGLLYMTVGRSNDAHTQFEQTVQISRQIGDRQQESASLNNLGMLHEAAREVDEALRCYRASNHIDRIVGDRKGVGIGLGNIAVLLLKRGEAQSAKDHLTEAVQIASTVSTAMEGFFRCNLAGLLAQLKQHDQALEQIELGMELLEAQAEPYLLLDGLAMHISVTFRAGETHTAQTIYDRAIRMLQAMELGEDARRTRVFCEIGQVLRGEKPISTFDAC